MAGTSASNDTTEQAKRGGNVISDTTATTGDWKGLLILADTIIGSITADSKFVNFSDLEDGNDNVTLAAGLYIPVEFTAITLASGAVLAINRY